MRGSLPCPQAEEVPTFQAEPGVSFVNRDHVKLHQSTHDNEGSGDNERLHIDPCAGGIIRGQRLQQFGCC